MNHQVHIVMEQDSSTHKLSCPCTSYSVNMLDLVWHINSALYICYLSTTVPEVANNGYHNTICKFFITVYQEIILTWILNWIT